MRTPLIVSTVAASNHTCALSQEGDAYCWGNNANGQLGVGNQIPGVFPARVATALAFTGIATGLRHTCAVASDGAVHCWGQNIMGQLGDGTDVERHTPSPVSTTVRFVQMVAGFNYSCGLALDGSAHCWGLNSSGALGVAATTSSSSTPIAVAGGLTFATLAGGGNHACGLTGAGAAYCWGSSASGETGQGNDLSTPGGPRFAPSLVVGGLVFDTLVAGIAHTCGLTPAGVAHCWGLNDEGQLGDGTQASRSSPVAVSGGLSFTQITAGTAHSCALTVTGQAYCWGYNNYGALGLGAASGLRELTPVALPGALRYRAIAAYQHSCGISLDGPLYCWGRNLVAQVGDGSTINRLSPVPIHAP